MKRACGLLAIISVFLLFMPGWLAPQSTDLVLKGIKEIGVVVENLGNKETEIGLTVERIKTATELKLRREGIIITDKSYPRPFLYVRISVVERAFFLELKVFENVVLERDNSISCVAATWTEGTTGTTARNADFIISALDEVLDEFLNDYYKANPKR